MPLRFSLLFLLILPCCVNVQAQIDPRLLTAIQQNNPLAVKAALRNKASRTRPDPNATDSLGATPLMWACYKADTAVVQLLVKAGAKTECRGVIRTDSSTYYGNLTGLAAGLNKLPLLRYLLEILKLPVNEPEYNPETKQKDGWTPAEWAACYGRLDVLRYLTDRGANLQVGKGNLMALAISRKQPAIMGFLLERGLVLDSTNASYGRVVVNYFQQLIPTAQAFEKQGQYHPGVLAYEQLRTIYGGAISKQDKTYATLLNNLAGLYESISQYEKALPLHLEGLTIKEKVLGKLHPSYATTLNNLAGLYKSMGQYEKALPLCRDGLTIRKKVLGRLHPEYASTLNNLADLYELMGQYEKALPLYREDLSITEKVPGRLHPDYATTLNNLAG